MKRCRGGRSPAPLDHGYSWVVLAASVFLHFLAAGNFGTFGLLFVEFVEHYRTSKSAASWIGGIQIAMFGLSGIVVGPLLKKFEPRPVVMLGATCVVFGFVVSRFVENLELLYLTFGVIPGFGFCCLQMGGAVSCQLYFNRRRSLALGVAMTGIGLGAFAWPPLTAWLIGVFSWKGAVLIIAAIQLHAFICAAIIRPIGSRDAATEISITAPIEEPGSLTQAGIGDKRADPSDSSNPNNNQGLLPVAAVHSSHATFQPADGGGPLKPPSQELAELERLTGEQANKTRPETETSPEAAPPSKKSSSTAFVFCDPCLVKDPGYWAFMFGQYFEQVGHYLPFTYLPLRGLHIGYEEQTASFLVTCLAISSVSTRILIGFLGDRIGHYRVYVVGSSIVLAGIASALSFFCGTYGSLAGYGVIFGCISACYAVLQQAVLVDIWGLEKIAVCTGHLFMMSGFGSLTLHPLTGRLLDSFKDPAYPFMVLGSVQTIGGVFILAAPLLHRRFAPAPASPERGGDAPIGSRAAGDSAKISGSCISLAV